MFLTVHNCWCLEIFCLDFKQDKLCLVAVTNLQGYHGRMDLKALTRNFSVSCLGIDGSLFKYLMTC